MPGVSIEQVKKNYVIIFGSTTALRSKVNKEYHAAVVLFHMNRFKKTYQHFFSRPETFQAANFFFDRLYTLEGKAQRDEITRQSINRFHPLLRQGMLDKLEKLVLLNDITDYLDLSLASILEEKKIGLMNSRPEDFEEA